MKNQLTNRQLTMCRVMQSKTSHIEYFKRILTTIVLLVQISIEAIGQAPLKIEICYELARQNFPLIKQKELLNQSREFNIANVHSGYLPQVTIYGQATYQSEVTQVPIAIPGSGIEPLSKTQYKVYAELNQTLYDGGTIKSQSSIQDVGAKVEEQKVEVELYKIKERINQIFFGVLLADAQLDQINLLKKDLHTSLAKVESAIQNGTSFKSNADILRAEILKSGQRIIETNALRKAYVDMLGYFINQSLNEDVQLEKPVVASFNEKVEIARPELALYKYQSELANAQYGTNHSRNRPRVSFFVQGGYGLPALNQLKNEAATYYLGGLRLNWSLSGLYNSHRDKQLLDLNVQQVNVQKEAFLFNTNLVLKQQSREVQKLSALMEVDNQLIELRTRIINTAKAQHENGVISTNDYLRELNAEDQAKQNLLLHQIQLLMAQYNYQATSGN
jgi:outer membrane protein TolC